MVTPEIISHCRAKRPEAFKALYEACVPYVYKIVIGYVKSDETQKDLIQEVFAKVFLKIHQFDPAKGEFRFWLRKVVVNQCLMHLRSQTKNPVMGSMDNIESHPAVYEEMQITSLDLDWSDRLLRVMPNGYRQVFTMVVLDGCTHEEVSKELGISLETSRSQLARSKQWVRNYLSTNKMHI